MKYSGLLAVALYSMASGGQAVQTDWSSGPGSSGPDPSWASSFDSSDEVAWLSVPGQLALSSSPLEDPPMSFVEMSLENAYSVDVGDIDGDGDADVIGGGGAGDGFCIWYSDGLGGWAKEIVYPDADGVTGTDIADINGDGHYDLLCTTYFGGEVLLYMNDGSTVPVWTQQMVCDEFEGGHDVEAFDMDGDGDLDILAAAAEADLVTWWRNDGGNPISWHRQDISSTVDYPCRIEALDINQDGYMDVVASMWLGDRVVSWYGSGGSSPDWLEHLVYYPISGAHCVRSCDADDDGDPDLLVSALDGGNLILMRNGGGNPVQWTREYVSPQTGCGYARPGDIDGDGDQDILSCSFGPGGTWWYENTGSGTTWVQHEVLTGMGSMACSMPADIDGDGDLDALITCRSTNRIVWCELTEFLSSGWLMSSILDTGGSPQWASIDWEAFEPGGTDLWLSYRTSDDPSNMGEWSSPVYWPKELSGMVDRYFQYRVDMETSDPAVSPLLFDVEFNWDHTGTGGGCPDPVQELSLVGGNPVYGTPVLRLVSNSHSARSVMVYDGSGRMLWSSSPSLAEGSEVLLQVDELPSGTYRVLLTSPEGIRGFLPMVVIR